MVRISGALTIIDVSKSKVNVALSFQILLSIVNHRENVLQEDQIVVQTSLIKLEIKNLKLWLNVQMKINVFLKIQLNIVSLLSPETVKKSILCLITITNVLMENVGKIKITVLLKKFALQASLNVQIIPVSLALINLMNADHYRLVLLLDQIFKM